MSKQTVDEVRRAQRAMGQPVANVEEQTVPDFLRTQLRLLDTVTTQAEDKLFEAVRTGNDLARQIDRIEAITDNEKIKTKAQKWVKDWEKAVDLANKVNGFFVTSFKAALDIEAALKRDLMG